MAHGARTEAICGILERFMPIEAVKIPQNVYVEDRIVGPLTLRQVMIVTLGGGGSYAIWSSMLKAYGQVDVITTAICWTPAVLALAFAFVRVNDLSLMRLVLLWLERMRKPTTRTWGPRTGISITIRTFTTEKKRDRTAPAMAAAKQQKLDELSSVLDETSEPEDTVQSIVKQPSEPTVSAELPAPTPASFPRQPVDQNRVQVSDHGDAAGVDDIRPKNSILSSSPSHA